jgi:hypothetical protein
MKKPKHASLFRQGLIDQARMAYGLVGQPAGPELDAAVAKIRAHHTRWLAGKDPADHRCPLERSARNAFSGQGDVFGTAKT